MTSDLRLLKARYSNRLGDDADAFIEAATTCAGSIQSMLDGLWVLARIDMSENGKVGCDLAEIFNESVIQLQPLISSKHAQVVADQLPVINANANQMEYMIQQLLENALKFCGSATPEIVVSAKVRDSEVEVCIKDNGTGFDMVHAGKIFKMFQRLDSDTPGIGLGLAVCKKIAEAHGGTMWATSAPLKGASFHFTVER
jgi:signal transduction histidine kinase